MDVYVNPSIDAGALATDLAQTVTRFRRALQRAARANFDGESLSPTEVELLLLVAERPGCGVAAAATELGAAPNTVSTLIRKLVALGLLRREFSRGDRRVARLLLTEEAQGRIERWRGQRADVLVDVLGKLTPEQRVVLQEAVPVLEAVSGALYQPRRRPTKASAQREAAARAEAERADEHAPADPADRRESGGASTPSAESGNAAEPGGAGSAGPEASGRSDIDLG
ncbi:MAG: MarR family winged helix-turn-helix transcriptional regulator [Acidimicrobiales bacterium]